MGPPSPNPMDGAAKMGEQRTEEAGDAPAPARRPPAPPKTLLAPSAAQLATKLQYVPLDLNSPGPSGIKQCFRTVKTVRRIPTMPRAPRAAEGPVAGSSAPAPTAPAARRAAEEKGEASKRHACRSCGKRFTSPGKLSQHLLSHTGELPFGCQYCDKRFNSKFKLVRHGLIHSESRAFACLLCDKTFHRKDHLNNHARVHDPVKSVYTCERADCRKRYTSPLSFKKHAALHSAEEGNLECKICSKVFESRAEIVYHLKVHTGSRTIKNEDDKKFTCTFCGRRFFTGKDVRRHLVVHTGRRDFVCQFCPQKFGRKDHLVRHVKNAHPDEPWQSSAAGASAAPAAAEARRGRAEARRGAGVARSKDKAPASTYFAEVPASLFLEASTSTAVKAEPETETDEETLPEEAPRPAAGAADPVKYEFQPNILFVMPPPPPYPRLEVLRDPTGQSEVSFLPPPDESIEVSLSSELVSDLESEGGHLELVERADVESILIDPDDGEEDLSLSNQILDLLESGSILGGQDPAGQPTVLPTFNQAFQNTAQSPKPPQPPPQ